MLKTYIKQDDEAKVLQSFEKAKGLIEYNFGIYHPLHATFQSFLA